MMQCFIDVRGEKIPYEIYSAIQSDAFINATWQAFHSMNEILLLAKDVNEARQKLKIMIENFKTECKLREVEK